jgi:hypothetical protein
MDEQHQSPPCFNCNRSENDIPIIAWRYQGQPLWVCCECIPNLIHKWPKVVAQLQNQPEE